MEDLTWFPWVLVLHLKVVDASDSGFPFWYVNSVKYFETNLHELLICGKVHCSHGMHTSLGLATLQKLIWSKSLLDFEAL